MGFLLMKRWSLGTYHGLRRKHADIPPNPKFRDNCCFYRGCLIETLLVSLRTTNPSHRDVINGTICKGGSEPL